MQKHSDQPFVSTKPISSGAKSPDSPIGKSQLAERRTHVRYAVSDSLEAVELQSNTRVTGRVSDLGRGGCYVDSISAFPKGAILKIRVTRHGEFFASKARVIVSSAGMGMSLMFTETEPAQLQTLEGWILELSGEQTPREPELPEIRPSELAAPDSSAGQSEALSDLILELMRTGALSDLKGRAILKKMRR